MFHFIVARNLPVAPDFGGVEGPQCPILAGDSTLWTMTVASLTLGR